MTATATLDDTAKKKALAEKLLDFMDGTGEESRSSILAAIKELKGKETVDTKGILEELEKIKAAQRAMQESIRRSRSGFYFPGVEDTGAEFSLSKACLGRMNGGTKEAYEAMGAGYEWSVIAEAQKKIEQVYPKSLQAHGKAMTAGDVTSAGNFIPDQTIPDVIERLYQRSIFFDATGEGDGSTRISILDGLTGSGNVNLPKFKGGFVAYWMDELDDITLSDATVGTVTFQAHEMGVATELTKALMDNAGYGFEGFFRRGMVRVAAEKLDTAIPFGRGGRQPRGFFFHNDVIVYRAEDNTFLTQGQAAAVSDWDGGVVDFDDLDNIDTYLEEQRVQTDGPNSWTMSSRRFFRTLAQLKTINDTAQTSGFPYLLGMPMLSNARLAELIGQFDYSTIFGTSNLPGADIMGSTDSVTAKYGSFARGNLDQAVWGRWAGIEVADDGGIGTGFLARKTTVRLVMRGDLQLRRGTEIIVCPDAKVRA